jgi:hypothetical protein
VRIMAARPFWSRSLFIGAQPTVPMANNWIDADRPSRRGPIRLFAVNRLSRHAAASFERSGVLLVVWKGGGRRYPGRACSLVQSEQVSAGWSSRKSRALIAILWRAGLRISEALALTESDLDPKGGSVLIRAGKGGKRRMVGIDDWAWEHVNTGPGHASSCRSGRCSAFWTVLHVGERGQRRVREPSCDSSPPRLACADASRRTSSGMHPRSRWPMRESRCRSSSGN